MVKILGISGRKQSGKNTVANYINGDILKKEKLIQEFALNTCGALNVLTSDNSGASGWGILDVTRKDYSFYEYAHMNLWPYVKVYHFADMLKEISISLFGLSYEQVYGNDEQKNTETNILWENMPENTDHITGNMTAREFLQHFGTNVIRKIKDEAWVEATINKILQENTNLAIIPDVRFPNEVDAIHKHGGIVIRLKRNVFHSDHRCESALDENTFDWNLFDHVIDNQSCTINDLCKSLDSISYIWRN